MITENYIKMCELAEEIQKEWRPKIGDYYYEKGHHKIFDKKPYHYKAILDKEKSYLFHKKYNDNIFNYKRFWLPTQEQLQEMVKDKWICEADMLFVFKYWIEKAMVEKIISVAKYTLTELWLAFVMYEKYHKIWTGEKWEKEK